MACALFAVCAYLLLAQQQLWVVAVLVGWPLYGLTWQLAPNRFTDEPEERP